MSMEITRALLVREEPKGEILEIEDDIARRFRMLSNFEVDRDPPQDHYFLYEHPDSTSLHSVCIKSLWASRNEDGEGKKRLMLKKEWEVLKSSLPETIFVCAYSSRPELMRAAVVGPGDDKSPYSYGVFFFDIMVYPGKAPQIAYLFKGVGIDMGRLVSGFKGEGSVVQSLSAIQSGMVERGRLFKEDKRNEKFIQSHKGMLMTLEKPPLGFGDLVRGYFRRFSHVILMQFKEFLQSNAVHMDKLALFHQLIAHFEHNGSYCSHIKLDLC